MSKTKKSDGVRLNLEVSPMVRGRLERLKDDTEAESLTEVVRRALAVYETLIGLATASHEIVIRDSLGNEQVLVLVP